MRPRIEYMKIAPKGVKAMRDLEAYLAECGLEPSGDQFSHSSWNLSANTSLTCIFCEIREKGRSVSEETEQRYPLF